MANRTLADAGIALTAALGGTISAGDTISIGQYAVDYTDGQLRDTSGGSTTRDLLRVTLGPGCRSNFRASAGGQLKTIVNQTGTGYLEDKSNCGAVEVVSDSASAVIYDVRYAALNGHSFALNTCDAEKFFQFASGTCTIQSACDLANAYVVAGRTVFSTSAYALTALHAGGNAVVTLSRDVANIYAEGACVITIDNTAVSPSGKVYLRGGTVKWIRGGTCADLECNTSGVADFSELSEPITISDRHMGPGSTLILAKNGIQPTFTTTTDSGGGPQIVYR